MGQRAHDLAVEDVCERSGDQSLAREPIRLVVGDGDQIVLLGLERLLSSLVDFAVVATATDGPESLAAVRAHTPDVTIMEIRMPGKSGLEVARAILREGL